MLFKNPLRDAVSRPLSRRCSRSAILSCLTFRNFVLLTGLVTCIGVARYFISYSIIHGVDIHIDRPSFSHFEKGTPHHVLGLPPPWGGPPPEPCIGPRGKLISDSPDDQLQPKRLKTRKGSLPPTAPSLLTFASAYPTPFAGSYETLELPEEWMTINGRYGPYGYDEGSWFGGRQTVDWANVDWGDLQMQCQAVNRRRFPPAGGSLFNASDVRFRLRGADGDEDGADDESDWFYRLRERLGFPRPSEYKQEETGRTALVLRTYGKYRYTEEDLINVRSLVSEAALQSGGDYTVVLLVNVRDPDKKIWESPENYAKALDEAEIPNEFRHLVVLWDEVLLQSWYSRVGEHRIMYQINQALQLFALFYPEFDHHWQLEMDMRSLGHTLTWLHALDRFSRREPRKQSVERASYLHLSATQGPYYPDFVGAVNATLGGDATIWGPLRIPEIPDPIGPPPPVSHAADDEFWWGVGEPADLVVTSPCTWVSRMSAWPFKGWLQGPFSQGGETPRMTCPPAIQRASRQLLMAVHAAQSQLGLAVPSEATLPSFALWHGLKLSFPPIPYFQRADQRLAPRPAEIFFNGGAPGEAVKLATPPDTDEGAVALQAEIDEFIAEGGGPDGEGWVDGELESLPFHDGTPNERFKGFACGEAFVNQRPRVMKTNGISWWWQSTLPRRIYAAWSKGRWRRGELAEPGVPVPEGGSTGDVDIASAANDGVLVYEDGEIWAPAGWLHPVKTFGE